jgi:hypothetical protein
MQTTDDPGSLVIKVTFDMSTDPEFEFKTFAKYRVKYVKIDDSESVVYLGGQVMYYNSMKEEYRASMLKWKLVD